MAIQESVKSSLRNPLAVIGLFIGVTEAGLGWALNNNLDVSVQKMVVICMTILALVAAIGLYLVLFKRPQSLFAPGDFKDDGSYLEALRELGAKVDRAEAKVDRAEDLAALVDRKIEAMPIHRYSKLPEAAVQLFLSIYRHLKFSGIPRDPSEVLGEIEKRFSSKDVVTALRALAAYGWIQYGTDGRERHIELTEEGSNAYRILSEFVYARFA